MKKIAMDHRSNSNTSQATKSCEDYFGIHHKHGQYFRPPSSICTECRCNNGEQSHCVVIQCQKPTCENHKQVPGKCCDYTCTGIEISDATTMAVLVTLSVALLLITIAIIVVWRKMRRKKLLGQRLDSLSSNNSTQDTNVDAIIQRNSIPNNIRCQRPLNMSSSSHTSSKYTKNFTNCNNINVSSTSYRKVASCELDHVSVDEKSKLTASEDTQIEDAITLLPSSSRCSHSNNDICCCRHGDRRFEPPPAYSPLKEVSLV